MVDLKATQVVDRMQRRLKNTFKPKPKRTPPTQHLSDIEQVVLVLPPTYRGYYERLKLSDPAKAQEFWDLWAFDPNTMP